MATEIGKGYVAVETDTKKLQNDFTGLGTLLGGKMGPLGSLLGNTLGSKMNSGIVGQLGGANKGIMSLGGALLPTGPWGIAAAAGVAAAAAVGVGLYKLGGSFEEQYRTIARATGATGKDLGALETSFKNVMKTTPASMDQISQAIIGIQRYTGPTGSSLETLSKQLLTMSRITGTDVKTNVEAATKAMENWAIPQKEAPKHMDALFAASQKSGVSFETLAGQVTKFAPQLRTMGYGLDDSVAMFGAFGKAGVESSTVMAAMKIAASNFAKQGKKDIPEAMKETIKGIEGASSTTDAFTLASKTFGARGATAMVDAIRSGKFNFDEMNKAVENSNNSISDTAARTKTLGGAWGKMKNQAMVALEPIATTLFKNVNTGLIALLNGLTWAMENFDKILVPIKAFFSVWTAGFRVIMPLLKAFGDAIALVSAILTGNWSAAGDAVKRMMSNIGEALLVIPKLIFELVTMPFRMLGVDVAAALSGLWATVSAIPGQIIGFLAGLPGAVIGAFVGAFSTVVGAATSGISGLWGWLSAIPGRVLGALAGLGGAVFGALVGGFAQAVGGANAGIGGLWGWLGGIAGRVAGGLANLGGAIFNAMVGGFSQAVNGANAGLGGLWGLLSSIPGRVISAIGHIDLAGVGRQIIDSLVGGITGAIGKIGDAMGGVANKIKSFLPFSPAKEGPLAGKGDPLYAGLSITSKLTEGLTKGSSMVTAAMTDMLTMPDTPTLTGGTTAAGAGATGGRYGPAVVIENATFNDEADIEMLMRKMSWAVALGAT